MHNSAARDDTQGRKPEIINFYNHSKVGVDVFDQMARKYSALPASFAMASRRVAPHNGYLCSKCMDRLQGGNESIDILTSIILELIKELTSFSLHFQLRVMLVTFLCRLANERSANKPHAAMWL